MPRFTLEHPVCRGVALSSDGSTVYTTWIQQSPYYRQVWENSTSTGAQLNQYVTAAGYDSVNGPPGREQMKSIATDDRGYVYFGSGDRNGESPYVRVLDSNLSTPEVSAKISTTDSATTMKRIGGAATWKDGSTYYLYISRESGAGSAYIQRFNVTDPVNPVLDASFGTGGTFNLATLDGFSSAGSPRGLEVAGDGTIYLTATLAPTTSDGTLYKIAPDLSSASSANVSGAMDVALFGGKAYVTQYLAGSSDIEVLDASTLAAVETITIPGFVHSNTSTDSGYSGIDISASGQIYLADQYYDNSGGLYRDRLLVSSPVPEPATLTLLGLAGLSGLAAMWIRRRKSSA